MITHHVSTTGYGEVEATPDKVRKIVYGLEQILMNGEMVEVPVEHEFAEGMYFRKILIKKGISLTGRIHKQNDLQIVFYGDISILTENGLKRFTGPNSMTAKAGIKPFALAHEDTLFGTVHHTHLTDLAEIERELFEDEPNAKYEFDTGKLKQEVLACRQ